MLSSFTSAHDVYEVVSEYAKGGMGTTYLVRSRNSGERLILKELRMDKAQDWKAIELFDREVQVLRHLDHPNIPKYIDHIASDDKITFAMVQTFIEGKTLQQLIAEKALFSHEQFSDYLCQCLDVLAYLHGCVPPVIHRDISPKNIIIGGEKAYIVDFGAVKSALTPTSSFSTVVGTFGYMAQEQVMGNAVPASDMYSLGMSFVAFATRREPEQLTLDDETGQVNVRELLELPDKLEAVLEGMTRLNLTERLCDARQAIKILKAIPTAVATRQSLTSPYVEVGYKSTREITPIKLGKISIKNELNLVNFIQQDASWHKNLIEDKAGYEMLLMWIAQIQSLEAKTVFDRMVQEYRKKGPEYVREAILRYFIPERPVDVNGQTFDFFSAQDIGPACGRFFEAVDALWKQTDLETVKRWLFQFEFSLRRLADVSAAEMKTAVRDILERVASLLGVELQDGFSDYRATLHEHLNWGRLVRIFHAFDPERPFKDLADTPHDSIESMAFHLAANKELLELGREEDRHEELTEQSSGPKKKRKKKEQEATPEPLVRQSSQVNDERIRAEKNAFLCKHGMDSLCDLSYRELLFAVFRDHVHSDVQVRNIAYDQPEKGKCAIEFAVVGKSLTDYFRRRGLEVNLIEAAKRESLVLPQKAYFRGASLYRSFILALEKECGLNERMVGESSKAAFRKITGERFHRCFSRDAVSFLRSLGLLLPLLGSALFYRAYIDAEPDALAFLNVVSPIEVKYVALDQNPYGLRAGILLLTLLFLLPALAAFLVPLFRWLAQLAKEHGWFMVLVQIFATPILLWIIVAYAAFQQPSLFAIWVPVGVTVMGFVVLLINRLVQPVPLLFALMVFLLAGAALFPRFDSSMSVLPAANAPVVYSATVIHLLGQQSHVTLHREPDATSPKVGEVERGKKIDVLRDTLNWALIRSDKAAGFVPNNQIRRLAVKVASVVVDQGILYAEPSRNSEAVQELFKDASLGILEYGTEWHFARRGSNEGYVHASDVRISTKETATVTVRAGKDCQWIRSEIVFYVDGTAYGRFRAGKDGLQVEVPVGQHVLQAACDEMNWGPQTRYIDIEGTEWNMGCQR